MIDQGRFNVLGVMIDAVDYESAVAKVMVAASKSKPYAVSALAVHGVMTGADSPEHRSRLNMLNLVVPDGQPVRWALKLLHGANLDDRVYGPTLTNHVILEAERTGKAVYFFGSSEAVLNRLKSHLESHFPQLAIAGMTPSRFRQTTEDERQELVRTIKDSGASITFVGLGCPRQEIWAFENAGDLSMPVIAVGAAFDFLSGSLPQAPQWMQRYGLEWLFRLKSEPRRLWKRYLVLNPRYIARLAKQWIGVEPDTHPVQIEAISPMRYG